MPSRLPDRNKAETVKVPKTVRVGDMTFFKGSIVTDEATAQRIRKELKRDKVVRPYVERSDQVTAPADEHDENQVADEERPGTKASEHL